MQKKTTQVDEMTRATSDYTTVTLTRKKMEAAEVTADITHDGDLLLSIPTLPADQQRQLDALWEALRHDLQDISTDPAVVNAVLEAACHTHWKETNARIILNLI